MAAEKGDAAMLRYLLQRPGLSDVDPKDLLGGQVGGEVVFVTTRGAIRPKMCPIPASKREQGGKREERGPPSPYLLSVGGRNGTLW